MSPALLTLPSFVQDDILYENKEKKLIDTKRKTNSTQDYQLYYNAAESGGNETNIKLRLLESRGLEATAQAHSRPRSHAAGTTGRRPIELTRVFIRQRKNPLAYPLRLGHSKTPHQAGRPPPRVAPPPRHGIRSRAPGAAPSPPSAARARAGAHARGRWGPPSPCAGAARGTPAGYSTAPRINQLAPRTRTHTYYLLCGGPGRPGNHAARAYS